MTRGAAVSEGEGGSSNCPRHLEALVFDDGAAPPQRSLVLGDDAAMLVAAVSAAGATVHVSEDAAKTTRNLRCPGCSETVIAVKGPIRAHHFRHRSRAACVAGSETALHLLAKRVLAENPTLHAPAIIARCGARAETLRPPFRMTLSDIQLETREPGVTPDLAASAEGAPVFIEIAVTHRVDETKRKRLVARGVSTLEIDLSRLPCSASYALIAMAIRSDAPRRWVYSRRAEARATAMQREGQVAEAREAAWLKAAANAAVSAFAMPSQGDGPAVDEALQARIALLGLENLLIDADRADGAGSAFTIGAAAWRTAVVARFLLAPCDDVAAHGAPGFRPGSGYEDWDSYPVARFSVDDVVGHLVSRGFARTTLSRIDSAVAACARERLAAFETPQEAVERFVASAIAAGMAADGADWGGERSFHASDALLGRIWRETTLHRATEIVDRALHGGEIEPGRAGRWLTTVAAPEIRGAHAGDRLLPRLLALADLVRVFERSGAARRGRAPPDIRDEARKLGFDIA